MNWTFLLLALSLSAPSGAQVEARQATPDEVARMETGRDGALGVEQMKNPMLLEIPLKLGNDMNVFAHFSRNGASSWSTTKQARFVVDRARVEQISVSADKLKKKAGAKNKIVVGATIASDWHRQDIDVTLSLVDQEGKEIARRFWDDETFGNNSGVAYSGYTKTLELELKVEQDPFFSFWSENPTATPTLKVLLQVQDDGED